MTPPPVFYPWNSWKRQQTNNSKTLHSSKTLTLTMNLTVNLPHYYVDHSREDRQTMPSADLVVTSRVGGSPHPGPLCCAADATSREFRFQQPREPVRPLRLLPSEARRRYKIMTTPLHYLSHIQDDETIETAGDTAHDSPS